MSDQFSCAEVGSSGAVARYVAGSLGPGETEAFEEHLFECGRCQDDVALAAGVRRALRQSPRVWPRWPGVPRLRAASVAVGLSAVLILAAALLFLMRGTGADVRHLGIVVQPPVYLGEAVRGSSSPGELDFEAAMTLYAAGRYADAAEGLRNAMQAGMSPAPAWFFLGASLLMLDESQPAADAFSEVIALGGSPYLAEAHYYRGRALLRMNRPEPALDELHRAGATSGPIAAEAAALADSVRAIIRRR